MIRASMKLGFLIIFSTLCVPAVSSSYRLDFAGSANQSSESFVGYIIIDYSTPGESFNPDSAVYENSITDFQILFANELYILDQSDINGVSVTNNDEFFGFDAFSVTLQTIDPENPSDSELFFLQLTDSTMTAFDSLDLPTSLSIDDFDAGQSSIVLTHTSTQFSHPLEFVSIRPVPLPAALVLLLSGFSVFAAAGYRRHV